jgi:hypothetical protein
MSARRNRRSTRIVAATRQKVDTDQRERFTKGMAKKKAQKKSGKRTPRIRFLKTVKFDQIKREKYLELLRHGGRKIKSAEMIGITRQCLWDHITSDPAFAEKVSEAQAAGKNWIVECVEVAHFQSALDGDAVAQKHILKKMDPENWGDHIGCAPAGSVKVGVGVKVDGAANGVAVDWSAMTEAPEELDPVDEKIRLLEHKPEANGEKNGEANGSK